MNGTVLVVDDDMSVAQLLHDVLTLEGFHVVSVAEADRVRAVAEAINPDILVIDVMLRRQSGIEVAAELREGQYANLPMIGISGSPYLLAVADEIGIFDAVLPKPLDLEELLLQIVEALHAPTRSLSRVCAPEAGSRTAAPNFGNFPADSVYR